jgi:Cys-rich protein (TIGR01571 family)
MLPFLLTLLPFLYDGLKSTSHHWAPVVLPGKSAGPDPMERALLDDNEYSDCMEFGFSLEECKQWSTNNQTSNGNFLAGLLAAVSIILGVYLLFCVGQCVFMCQYHSKVVNERGRIEDTNYLDGRRDFNAGLFGCCDDCSTCLHGFFCTACRAGDTYEAIGGMSYYTVIGVFVIAEICGGAVDSAINHIAASQGMDHTSHYAHLVFAIIVSCIMFSQRRNLREKLGGNNDNAFIDCCLWYWCMPCVVTQEARDLDNAMGVQVECCCNLKRGPAAAASMVGNAYAVSG